MGGGKGVSQLASLLATAVVTAVDLVPDHDSGGVKTLVADLAVEALAVPHGGPGSHDLVMHEDLGVAAGALIMGPQSLGLGDKRVGGFTLKK